MDSRAKSLFRAEETTVLLEDGDRPVTPGTLVIRVSEFHGKITYIC
jgi:hypothetical protein